MNRPFASSLQENDPWFVIFNPQNNIKLRLFCFPYAGGDANIYRDWAYALPDGVEVIGVQYPGRGQHSMVSPISDCSEMVDRLHAAMYGLLDKKFMFFGHSNGALISFELATRLAGNEKLNYLHHFLSAKTAVHLPSGRKKISALDKRSFLKEIIAMGGTPREVVEDEVLMDAILPRLRADFSVGETYRYRQGSRLPGCASILYGRDDGLIDSQKVKRWSELVDGISEVHEIAGGHFYLHTHQDDVLKIIEDIIRAIVAGYEA
jgi:medium-chain acyl-[acyl-carrier-protein] hydrolase